MSKHERYRINRPTIALFEEDSRHIAHMIPEGVVIVADSETFNEDKLVQVLWAEEPVMMFTEDIRRRSTKVEIDS